MTELKSADLPAQRHPDEQLQTFVERVLIASPLGTRLGVQLHSLEPEKVVLRLPFDPGNVTVERIVHGGAIASLIDIAGAIGSASGLAVEAIRGGATSNMTVNYLGAADGVGLIAVGRVIQRSKRQTVTEVDVYADGDASRQILAKGIVTSRLF